MGISKYYYISKVNFFNSFVYYQDILARSLFVGLIIFIFTNVWRVVYGNTPLIEGYTIAMMLWYFVMAESIVTAQTEVWRVIGEEVKSGTIANALNKPYSYLFYHYALTIGEAIFKFSLTFLIGGLIVFFIIGGTPIEFRAIPLFALAALLGISIHFFIIALIGVFALWLEDVRGIYMVYQKLVFIIGGTLIPLEIFPQWLQGIAKWLPFSAVAYYPSKLFVQFSIEQAIKTILLQLTWLAIIMGIVWFVYKKLVRKVSVNGG